MILIGNQRAGAYELAQHLLKDENEHVNVHELRGFVSDDLDGALQEAYAVSKATKCKQYLFSLSLNPPADAQVSIADFEAAIERVENDLGLTGQPRAVVFHEKEGMDGITRRHAHAVWSRIDAQEMKARQLSYSKNKMQDVSRDLYLEHGWKMPKGLSKTGNADPRNFTLEQWQHAKRNNKDPRDIKTALQDAWAISDNKAAFTHAMEERGYRLARGDKRGFLAVDTSGKPYSLSRWSDVKPKDLSARLGDEGKLPSLEQTKMAITSDMGKLMDRFDAELDKQDQERTDTYRKERLALIAKQQEQRRIQLGMLEARQRAEATERQERFRTGTKGLWDRISGQHKRIQRQNELEALEAFRRDRAAKDELIFRHLEQTKRLKRQHELEISKTLDQKRELEKDRDTFNKLAAAPPDPPKPAQRRQRQAKEGSRTITPSAVQTARVPSPANTPERDTKREAFKQQRREAEPRTPARSRSKAPTPER